MRGFGAGCVLLVVGCGDADSKSAESGPAGDSAAPSSDPSSPSRIDSGEPSDSGETGVISDDTAATVGECAGAAMPEHLTKVATAELSVNNAKTEEWNISLSGAASTIAIGVWSDDSEAGQRACYQLDRVEANGEVWVHPPDDPLDQGLHCLTCPERVAVRQGAGWFVFRNSGAVSAVTTLTVRASVRACESGLPALAELGDPVPESLMLSVTTIPTVDEAPVILPVHLIDASRFDVEDKAREAIAAASAHFSAHGITLEWKATTRLEVADSAAVYEGADRMALRTLLSDAADAAPRASRGAVPVVLVDCLEQTGLWSGRPEGMATSIPGMPSTDCAPDGVFVRMAQCLGSSPFEYPWSTESLGAVIAHEIGHYMGLYHSVESDGTEDHLADTDSNNLMHYRTLSSTSTGLSETQARIIRMNAALFDSE